MTVDEKSGQFRGNKEGGSETSNDQGVAVPTCALNPTATSIFCLAFCDLPAT